MELHGNKAQRHAKVLEQGSEAWFYGYHVSDDDMVKIENALAFFTHEVELLREKQLKEGTI